MNNKDLVAEIERARAAFDEAASAIAPDRRTEPMFDDGWAFKDILVHLTTWEKIAMGIVRNDGYPGPPPGDGESGSGGVADQINARVYADNRHRALDDVVADAERTHAELLDFVATLPEGRLDERLGGDGEAPLIREVLAGNSYQHYREHAEWLRAALART